jgi:hypothetical protein
LHQKCVHQRHHLYAFYHTFHLKDDEDNNRGLGTISHSLANRM